MKTFSLFAVNGAATATASPALRTVLFASLLVFLGWCVRDGGAQETTSTDTNTYMFNTSGYRVMQLRCDSDGSSNSNSASANDDDGTTSSTPMCTIETYGQSCNAAYMSGSLDDPPYFLPTSGDDYAELTECRYLGDGAADADSLLFKTNGANGATAKFEGLVTVTCDSVCTCATGSYGSSSSYSSTFIPDGGSCPIQKTVTYQYDTSDRKGVELRCDGTNSTEVTWRPMCTIQMYGQSCWRAWDDDCLDIPPYFRPTNGNNYARLGYCSNSELDDDDYHDDDGTAPYEGALTITCDAACTCETGSYATPTTDAYGNVISYTDQFFPDGGSCPIISTQPGEQVGPSLPYRPPKYFSGANVRQGDQMQVWCVGGDDEKAALYGECESGDWAFGYSTSFKSTELYYGYKDCIAGGNSCLVTCPSICTCTVVTTDYDIVITTAAEAQAGYPCEERDGKARSLNFVNVSLRTLLCLFLASCVTAAIIIWQTYQPRTHGAGDFSTRLTDEVPIRRVV